MAQKPTDKNLGIIQKIQQLYNMFYIWNLKPILSIILVLYVATEISFFTSITYCFLIIILHNLKNTGLLCIYNLSQWLIQVINRLKKKRLV